MKLNSVRKNAVLNTAKQLCQIVFPVITIPYVTRILGVQNYGRINFSNSIVNYFLLLASLGINSYAVREGALLRDNRAAFNKFSNEVFSINVFATLISYCLLLFLIFIPQLVQYRSLILVQSLTIVLTTLGADWINSVYEDYFYISLRYILFQLLALILLFSFVHKSNDYIIYALILVVATAGGNLLNIFYIRRYAKLKIVFKFDWRKRLIPILILFGNQVAITIYVNSDITILGLLSNERAVGWYSLSSKIYIVIQQMLNALLIVSVPRLSYYLGKNKHADFKKLILSLRKTLLVLIAPIVTLLFCFSDIIVEFVGGHQYIMGSASLKILAVTVIFSLLAALYTNCILLPFKLEKKILLITSFVAIINVLLNLWLVPLAGANGAAMTTLISEIIVSFWSQSETSKVVKIRNNSSKDFYSVIIGTVYMILVCYFLKKTLIINPLLLLICSGIVAVIGYLFILFILKNSVLIDEVKKYKLRHY